MHRLRLVGHAEEGGNDAEPRDVLPFPGARRRRAERLIAARVPNRPPARHEAEAALEHVQLRLNELRAMLGPRPAGDDDGPPRAA